MQTQLAKEHTRIMRENPVRQMWLFGSSREERREIESDHRMRCLFVAIENVADSESKRLNKKYNV